MKRFFNYLLPAVLAFGMFLCSCTKESTPGGDDETNEHGEYIGDNPYVLVLSYAPAEGFDYSYYPIQYKSLMDAEATLSAVGVGSITQVGYYEYAQLNQTIYSTGGLDYTDVSTITRNGENELNEAPFGIDFTNAIEDVVTTDDGTLIGIEMNSTSDVVVMHLIDSETNAIQKSTTTSCFNISKNMDADNLPVNSGLVQSGDYVYVSYFLFDGSFTTSFVSEAEVAVFSYPELEYITTITDDRTGPIGGWATNSGLFLDESGNIYALSHTNIANGYTQSNPTAGFLRINKNDTVFDTEYFFDLTTVGEGYTTANAMYLGGNKLFAEMNVAARSEQVAWSDGPLKSAIIDLSAETVEYFTDCPEHNGPGRDIESTALYNEGYIYNPIPTTDGIFMYRMDPTDMSTTKGAKINASFVAGTFRLH